MSHQEKQEIFDQYAQKQGYQKWEDLVMFSGFTFSARLALITHMYNACDLVQEEQQKRIAEKAELYIVDDCNPKKFKIIEYLNSNSQMDWDGNFVKIDESSIINPENIIK